MTFALGFKPGFGDHLQWHFKHGFTHTFKPHLKKYMRQILNVLITNYTGNRFNNLQGLPFLVLVRLCGTGKDGEVPRAVEQQLARGWRSRDKGDAEFYGPWNIPVFAGYNLLRQPFCQEPPHT